VGSIFIKDLFFKYLPDVPLTLVREEPLPDFGGAHPIPIPKKLNDLQSKINEIKECSLGFAVDADADSYIVMGRDDFFVSPSDSLAVIANYLAK